jgi:hypothetical protein
MAGITAHAQRPYYYVSGKVVDYKTGKGISDIYVAFQGLYIGAFFGGPETFVDLVLDSTDKHGNFKIKVPAALADSFSIAHSGPLCEFNFVLDVRTARSPEWPDLTPHQHIIPALFNINDSIIVNGFYDRITINHRTRIFPDITFLRKDISNIVVPFYKGSFLQFEMANHDTSFFDNNHLYVSVQQLSKEGAVKKHGHTTYSEHHHAELTLAPPYVPLNIVLAKLPIKENKLDTLTIIKNVSLQPGEVKKIAVPVDRQ